jgi:predicted short-subunit dehydrogenase-like oxidoreductase (DUF2520 family)
VKRTSIAIVGSGRLGSSLAVKLNSVGYRVAEIVSRDGRLSTTQARRLAKSVGASSSPIRAARLDADVIWFCVPDSQIALAANDLGARRWKGRIALHSSGVLVSGSLRKLRERGASVASVHPLMTFLRESVPNLTNAAFALEGDPAAVHAAAKIVREFGGKAFRIRPQDKAAYHAFATLICPLFVSLLAVSERAAVMAGISTRDARSRLLPIIRQTLANYERLGPKAAFTGPIVRGDVETVRLHLQALARVPVAKQVYRALAKAALQTLPSRNRAELKKLLRA